MNILIDPSCGDLWWSGFIYVLCALALMSASVWPNQHGSHVCLFFTMWWPAFAPALTYESSMSVILTIQWHLQALQAVKQQMTMVVPPSLSVTKSEPISKMTSMPVTSILGFTITPGISKTTKRKAAVFKTPDPKHSRKLERFGRVYHLSSLS